MKLECAQRLREYCRNEAAFEGLQQLFNTLEANHRQAQEQILFLTSLLDQVCNAIIATDKDGKIVYWNRYAQTLYQWQAKEVIGKSIYEAVTVEVNRQQAEAPLSAVKSTDSRQRELVVQRKDGSQFVAEVCNAVLRDHAGNLIGCVGIYTDATERKPVEEALRKSEERYRALYEETPSIYFTIDDSETILSVNAFGAEQLGYTPGELVGKSILKVIYEDDKPAVQEHLSTCLQQPASVSRREVRKVRKDGSLLWVRQVARAVAGSEGNLLVLMVCEDITEQKQAQEALLQSEAKNRALLQAMPDLMLRLDKNGTFLDFKPATNFHNPACERAFLGKQVSQVWPAEPGHLTMHYIERALKTGEMQIFEYQLQTPNQIPKFQVLTTDLKGNLPENFPENSLNACNSRSTTTCWEAPSYFEARIVVSGEAEVLAIIRDITERKQAEVNLQRQTERERLMAEIAANIRRSLNLNEILNTTVAQVRQFLQCDRVLIYQFEPDGSGEMVVESVASGWSSAIGTKLNDPCFTANYIQPCRQGQIQATEDIYTADLSPCNLDLFNAFQIRANLVIPIFIDNSQNSILDSEQEQNSPETGSQNFSQKSQGQSSQLWGLLIANQCSEPRKWQAWESDWLQHLATQVGIALQQSSLFQQVQQLNAKLENQVQERTSQLKKALKFAAGVQRITDEIRDSLDEAQILQTAVVALAGVLKADYCGAALYNSERTTATIRYEATQPQFGSALGCTIEMTDAPKAYSRLLRGEYYQSAKPADLPTPELSETLVVKLLCPISSDDQGVIGHLAVFNRIGTVLGKTEILLVQQVANQCAIAIRQARLYQASRAQVEELAKLNRLKDDFLSTVSHELRSPIANMKMAIHLLQAAADHDRRERYLKILRTECERENDLINDLLDLQRLEADVYLSHTTALDLSEWLPTIVAPFNCRTFHRQQTLEVDYPPELPPIVSAPISLGRILTELLNNACKYTSAGGKITLNVRYLERGGESLTPDTSPAIPLYLFTVVNQAEIPQAELPRIFEKFYRVPNADPWQQGGTGLGLALVHKLIEQLGGTIQVESDAGWTAFTVALPTCLNENNQP